MNESPAAPLGPCHALVPCAGSGERAAAGLPKQYALVAGQPVVARTLRALAQVRHLTNILVVLAPDDDAFERHVPQPWDTRLQVVHEGGRSRAASVRAGLAALLERGAGPGDWVLVHDAARCLVRPESVNALIDACRADEVGGLLALPLSDTLKQAAGGRARSTLERGDKWLAQTPQMFRLGMLARALDAAGEGVTDEASAMEALGLAPRLVRGDARNLKLTWPEDFETAERLLQAGPGQEIKAFVPARDFQASLRFYVDLGFQVEWSSADLAGLRQGTMAFLLQDFHVPAHAENFAMHMSVQDLQGWWSRIDDAGFRSRHSMRAEAPQDRPWGLRDMVLIDPSGVLWRIAQAAAPG